LTVLKFDVDVKRSEIVFLEQKYIARESNKTKVLKWPNEAKKTNSLWAISKKKSHYLIT